MFDKDNLSYPNAVLKQHGLGTVRDEASETELTKFEKKYYELDIEGYEHTEDVLFIGDSVPPSGERIFFLNDKHNNWVFVDKPHLL